MPELTLSHHQRSMNSATANIQWTKSNCSLAAALSFFITLTITGSSTVVQWIANFCPSPRWLVQSLIHHIIKVCIKKKFCYDSGCLNGNKPLLPLVCSHFRQVSPFYPAWIKAYTVKKAFLYSCPQPGCHLLSLGGNNDVTYKLFPPSESLVSDIPAGDGNTEQLFYGVAIDVAP